MAKAKKTGSVMYGKYSNIVEYEYKGRKYEVEYAKDMTYCCTSPAVQHREAQEKIDAAIDRKEQPKRSNSYKDTAEYGFNLFWDYCEGKICEDDFD